jgi:uncharacterized membrane protein
VETRQLESRRDREDEDDYEVDLGRLYAWASRRDPVRWVLFGMAAAWAIVFITLGLLRHNRFGTFGFDLGIYDQGIWLLSQFKDPFVTIRGLDLFGHHANVALLLFTPFYRLGAGPEFLLVAQVTAQASGAAAVYLLARDRLGTRWPAVALAGVLLLHPSYQFQTWHFFHPDSLAIGPLLFAYWAARARRWRWFALAAVLAVACKEDVALPMAAIGLLIAARGDRRIGILVAALSAAWFMIATRVIIPLSNGIGPFYDSFFGDFGSTAPEVVVNVATSPGKALDVATQPDRISYYRMMFAPFAFLPLLAPSTLLVAVPMLAVNALSTWPYQRDIKFHYTSLVLAGLIVATVEAVAWAGRTPQTRAFLIGLVAATSLAATVAWGPSPLSTKYRTGFWPLHLDERVAAREAVVDFVPTREAASAHYNFVPHMTHREKIYEWPVPWEPANWGVRGENLHDPAGVRWLVLDREMLTQKDSALLERLLAGEFVVRFDENGILAAERVRPPGRA